MKSIKFKRKAKYLLASLFVLGQVVSSSILPSAVNASIVHPEEITVEYDNNKLYVVKGTNKDGSSFDERTPPLEATYDGKRDDIFCIESAVPIVSEITTGYKANPLPSMSVRARYISVLWKYAGKDDDTKIVAQTMIWEEHEGKSINYIRRPDGTMVDIDAIKAKINKVIDDYVKKPSFNKQNVTVKLGESITLTDTDNVGLERFDTMSPKSDSNVKWSIQGNKLTITPTKDSKENGILRLFKSIDEGTPVAYKLEGSQTVMAGAIDDPNFFDISINVIKTGDVKVTKLDEVTGEPVPNTEFDFAFDGKTEKVKTDNKGVGILKDIYDGTKVKVTETFVPAPYILAKNNTKEITVKANEVTPVVFKNERATGKTTITKQDATTESDEPLNPNYPITGAKYGLFKEDGKDGVLVEEFDLDDKLTATKDKLELGTYYWMETKAPVGYKLDQTKHVVELLYKDQNTPVVIKDALSLDDVIRMNIDGQKLIQNATNEIFKNGIELTLTNKRTGEKIVIETATVDGKKGYFKFADIPLDDYILEETKGVENYANIDPIEINHLFDKETETFTFIIKDQKSGNVLDEIKLTQEELSQGENVDLGTYTLKDKAVPSEEPSVAISTQAHTGDGKTQTFTWGDDIKLYDDVNVSHKNIPVGTKRGLETILVAIYTDEKGKETEKDVWSSGIVEYEVSDKDMTERVQAEYDYKKDPEGTRYRFRELGHNKTPEDEFEEDAEHNRDGKEKKQDITPVVKETPTDESKEEKKETSAEKGSLPNTGEQVLKILPYLGVAMILGVVGFYMYRNAKNGSKENKEKID